jgi:hypothetical protein
MSKTTAAAVMLVSIGVHVHTFAAQGPLRLADAFGKSRIELAAAFPGPTARIRSWQGWDSLSLIFGRESQLVGLVLRPTQPMSEAQADGAVQRLGVDVDASKYFAGPREHGYSDMTGTVRTVIYDIGTDGNVSGIHVHARLADAE